MSFISKDPDLEVDGITSLMGYMAQKSNLCVKVLDRDGRVRAVNRRGLELLQATADDICGRVWASVWDAKVRDRAEAAVAAAFAGNTDRFTARYDGTDPATFWEVETFPLDRDGDGDAVTSILVISANLNSGADLQDSPTEDQQQMMRKMGDLLHTFSNVASATASGARLLKNTEDPARIRMVADMLEENVTKATEALNQMRDALNDLQNG